MKFLLGEADKGQVAWEEGEWYFVDTRRWQGQVPQLPPDAPAFDLETVLRKADIDKLIAYVTKHCIVATVEEAAAILRVDPETIYRMCDRGDLGRVPGIRHVRIPVRQVIFLSQGLKKDGSTV
jgi:excisionase family DNA binding protein